MIKSVLCSNVSKNKIISVLLEFTLCFVIILLTRKIGNTLLVIEWHRVGLPHSVNQGPFDTFIYMWSLAKFERNKNKI